MKLSLYILFVCCPFGLFAQKLTNNEVVRLEKQAKQITITRDNWGIPHVSAKTDALAVFGLLYSQCEDDFPRVEMNYIEKLGRLAEIKGQSFVINDMEMRLLINENEAKADYKKAEPWLKNLLNAYADGVNYFLFKNPSVRPKLLQKFEPWFPLMWTDGSIGAISTGGLTTSDLQRFYEGTNKKMAMVMRDHDMQTGSNGFAIAPSKTASGNAILYINPHTSFYFRPEVHIKSEEGLNAYGAVTWGQFFIYQGFNENCGWMHTSSSVDVADMYAEKIVKKKNKLFYEYDKQLKPVGQRSITIKYLENEQLKSRTFLTYFTHHGPIWTERDGKWISLKSNNRNMTSLVQSWIRTKSKNFEDYQRAMNLKANTSNNTVYADNKGNIAYWHGNFIPIRDKNYNWAKVVDGSISGTEWKGLHAVEESVHLYNPSNGWLQNCNSTPYSVAGPNSPKKQNYLPYMAPDGENFRAINAVRVLQSENQFTLDKIIEAGYNTYLAAFEILIPALVKNFENNVKPTDSIYEQLKDPIAELKKWNYYAAENSVSTTLAVEWAYKLDPILQKVYVEEGELDQVENTKKFAANATSDNMLPQLLKVIKELESKFGSWRIQWGDLNRYQRLSADIDQKYDDNQPSYPVAFGPALWGSLPAFKSPYQANTKKRYGVNGNSFVCAVEFGPKIKAKSLLTGGNSGNINSKHFNDQAEMYSKGKFKEVYFYPEDIQKNAERTYHPGE